MYVGLFRTTTESFLEVAQDIYNSNIHMLTEMFQMKSFLQDFIFVLGIMIALFRPILNIVRT